MPPPWSGVFTFVRAFAVNSDPAGVPAAWPSLPPERPGDRRACRHPRPWLAILATAPRRPGWSDRRLAPLRPAGSLRASDRFSPARMWRAEGRVQTRSVGRRRPRRYPDGGAERKARRTASALKAGEPRALERLAQAQQSAARASAGMEGLERALSSGAATHQGLRFRSGAAQGAGGWNAVAE